MVGLLVVAVAIAMVMVISLLLVRRKPYGTISHGIVEVRKTNKEDFTFRFSAQTDSPTHSHSGEPIKGPLATFKGIYWRKIE